MKIGRRVFLQVGGASLAGWGLWRLGPFLGGPPGTIEDLGSPVAIGRFHDLRVGLNAHGRRQAVYLAFAQAQGEPPFLLVVDLESDSTRQIYPPRGCRVQGFKSVYAARDGLVYVGGYKPARLLRFDPRRPDDGLMDLGVLPRANMVWWLLEGADDRVYMTTSSEARLFSYDPRSGTIEDHGRLSTENQYATVLLASESREELYTVVAPERYDVVAYDLRRRRYHGLLDARDRGVGFIGIDRGSDGALWAELLDERWVRVAETSVTGLPSTRLEDGRRARATAEHLTLIEPRGATQSVRLRYEAATWVHTIHAGPDGDVYVATAGPLRFCRHNPARSRTAVLGQPFATSDTSVGALVNWAGRIVLSGYPGCDLALYDPGRAWDKGPTPAHNPWTWGKVVGGGHTRPQAMVVGSDGLVYVASDAAYGVNGGAVACLDPNTGRTVYNLREPFATRSAVALAADPERPVVFIGSSSDAVPRSSQDAARVIAWDCARRAMLWERVPVPGAAYVSSLHHVAGGLCGTTLHDYNTQHFFVLDPDSGTPRHLSRTPVPGVIRGNVRLGADGWLYGLTHPRPTLFRIHPSTGVVERIARLRPAQGYALALTPDSAYFTAGAHLMRFRFDRALQGPAPR